MTAGNFVVVASPSDGSENLDSFCQRLKAGIREKKEASDLSCGVDVHEVTQLVDEDDLGDCFVVGLSFVPHPEADDQVEQKAVVTPQMLIKALFENDKAEVWVESQSPIPLAPPFGWKKDSFLAKSGNDCRRMCDLLKKFGMAIVSKHSESAVTQTTQLDEEGSGTNHCVSSHVYADVKSKLKEYVTLLEKLVRTNHPHIQLGQSAFGFQEYTHRGPGRFEVLFEPANPLYELLRDNLESQWIDSVCQYLGSDRAQLRLNISCVYSRPGAVDQDWHTDGDHYDRMARVGDPNDHRPYALCIFVPLIPLTAETGFTRFWPKSHLYPNLLGLARAADALQATLDGVDLQPGDFVMYDYTTWHKGVGNSSEVERPVIQFLYSCDWYKETKNYGTASVFDPPATINATTNAASKTVATGIDTTLCT